MDEGCGTGGLGGGTGCELLPPRPPIPSWWIRNRYVYVEGYGNFDTGHLRRGWRSAKFFAEQTKRVLAQGGGVFDNPAVSAGGFLRDDYVVNYSVSGSVTQDQVVGVLYGMYIDFEIGYEQHQGARWDMFSSFTPEDLPSDHIGFWAYINEKDIDEIPFVLESLGEVSPTLGGPFVVDTITSRGQTSIIGFPRNHEFLPMAPLMIDYGGGSFAIRWQNAPWPSWLEIVPILSGPTTWQRVE